jgi:hypothetical protein
MLKWTGTIDNMSEAQGTVKLAFGDVSAKYRNNDSRDIRDVGNGRDITASNILHYSY